MTMPPAIGPANSTASASSPASGQRPIHALTGLRGVAAWCVVFYHIRYSLTAILPASAIEFMAKGYLAVDLFFLLSGFVMWLNYGAVFTSGGLRAAPRFWWKRFARIWPLHALVLSAMVVFPLAVLLTGRDASAYPVGELPLHILLMQNWGMTGQLAWNHPAWSISAEFAAYLLFPLLVTAVPWPRIGTWVLAGVAAGLAMGLYLIFALQGHATLGADITHLGLWRCLAQFSMGAVLALVWQRHGGRTLALAAWGACAAILAIALLADLPETAFVPALFAAGLLALASDRGAAGRLFAARPLRWLGDISYATYLLHFFGFVLFKLMFVDASLQLGWWQLLAFVALLLAASDAVFRWFEKPAQRWLNTHSPRFAQRQSGAAAR